MGIIRTLLSILVSKISLVVVAILVVGGGLFFGVTRYRSLQSELAKIKANPNIVVDEEAKQLTNKVGTLMELPEEKPTLMTVTDAEKVKTQPFFAKAENGDKVLIYTGTKKAVLYRPGTNKIIEVAAINLGENAATISVALANGTNSSGLTSVVENLLKEKVNNLSITSKGNAQKSYSETIVVDLSGTKKAEATQLATLLQAKVASLPTGEAKPQGDILVILGADAATNLVKATPTPTASPAPTPESN